MKWPEEMVEAVGDAVQPWIGKTSPNRNEYIAKAIAQAALATISEHLSPVLDKVATDLRTLRTGIFADEDAVNQLIDSALEELNNLRGK